LFRKPVGSALYQTCSLTKTCSRIQQHLSVAIREVAVVQRQQHEQTSAKLEQIISKAMVRPLEYGPALNSIQHRTGTINGPKSSPTTLHGQQSASTSIPQLVIKTVSTRQPCEAFCSCQCHIRFQYSAPRWLSVVIGALFYSSPVRPAIGAQPCNSTRCSRANLSLYSHFTYYFPTWIMRKAIVCSTWKDLNGKNSSWAVTMPREVPFRPWLDFVQNGDLSGIQYLLARGKMSPYDVDIYGQSPLYVS